MYLFPSLIVDKCVERSKTKVKCYLTCQLSSCSEMSPLGFSDLHFLTWIISIGKDICPSSLSTAPMMSMQLPICVMLMWLTHFPISILSSIWYVSPFAKRVLKWNPSAGYNDRNWITEQRRANCERIEREMCTESIWAKLKHCQPWIYE